MEEVHSKNYAVFSHFTLQYLISFLYLRFLFTYTRLLYPHRMNTFLIDPVLAMYLLHRHALPIAGTFLPGDLSYPFYPPVDIDGLVKIRRICELQGGFPIPSLWVYLYFHSED
jgi:hypothetical protein